MMAIRRPWTWERTFTATEQLGMYSMNNPSRRFPILILLVVLMGTTLFLVRHSTLRELESERSRLERQLAEWTNPPVTAEPTRTDDSAQTNTGLSAAEFSELLRLRGEIGRLHDDLAKATNQIARAIAAESRPATDGARDGKADVTSAVQALVAGGSNSIVAGNGLFGSDPAYGLVKRLRVEYTLGGLAYTNETTEGGNLEIPAGAEVLRAIYGDFPALDPTREVMDVTQKVAAIMANGANSVKAANELAGFDPAPMIGKVLRVELLVDGVPRFIEADEGHPLDIPVGATVVQAVYGNLRGEKRPSQ
jgi:hypothetical protein